MKYEMIREIYNGCDNSKKRDVEISELEIENLDSYVQKYASGKDVTVDKEVSKAGGTVYHISSDGLLQKLVFTEI